MIKQHRWGIYAWYHMPTLRAYVGQTGPTVGFTTRHGQHLRDMRNGTHHSRYLQRAWNKYGEAEFAFVWLEDMTDGDTEQLTPREQWWMDNTDSVFNVEPAAASSLGVIRTTEYRSRIRESVSSLWEDPEYRARVSVSVGALWEDPEYRARQVEARLGQIPWNKGISHKPESNAKNSEAHKGKVPWNKGKKTGPLSPEHRAKISASSPRTRKPPTPETRARMSESAKKRPPPSNENLAKRSESLRNSWAARKAAAAASLLPPIYPEGTRP